VTLAIRGDRASCLSLQLGPRTWLLAAARGFGRIGGSTSETALLGRLRAECERRGRSARFRRAVDRPQTAATALLGVLTRVNVELYASTASHDDYVTAAASLTAVLVVQGCAFVMQAGATAAYLVHDGELTALSGDDLFEGRHAPLLFRAFATAPSLDVIVSSVTLAQGDVIVLLDHRLREQADRITLIAQLETSDPGEHVLFARIERDDPTPGEMLSRPRAAALEPWLPRIVAALAFLVAVVLAR
jgi:hypothetical protein